MMQKYLSEKEVPLSQIVCWDISSSKRTLSNGIVLGIAIGTSMAVVAWGYLSLLHLFPSTRETLEKTAEIAATYHNQRFWFALLVVGFAPIAEEYFFRGLLYRALDRELGDWRALVMSAALFAIIHPPIAWVPVACLGLASAWLFKHTRHLLPSILCHMAYNAGVVFFGQS